MKTKTETAEASWIDLELRLPDSVEAIEAGRAPKQRQGELFDDSLMARLRAIKAGEGER